MAIVMNIAEKAFIMLYPEKDPAKYEFTVKYSGKFSSYNANIKYSKNKYDFSLSKEWRKVSDDIVIGIFQHLLQRVFKTKFKSLNQDLYDAFLKNVHIAIPKDKIDLELLRSFDRVNEKYFLGVVEMPNLMFGANSFKKLGSYEYGSDRISISRVFKSIRDEDIVFLDYVMFHEMLHKVHKYKTVNGRSMHHTTKFKFAEKQFERSASIEKELTKFLRKKKFRYAFGLN